MVRAASGAVAFLPSCCRTQGPSWKFFEPSSPEKVERATGNTWQACSWPVPFHKSKRDRLKRSPEGSIPGVVSPPKAAFFRFRHSVVTALRPSRSEVLTPCSRCAVFSSAAPLFLRFMWQNVVCVSGCQRVRHHQEAQLGAEPGRRSALGRGSSAAIVGPPTARAVAVISVFVLPAVFDHLMRSSRSLVGWIDVDVRLIDGGLGAIDLPSLFCADNAGLSRGGGVLFDGPSGPFW